MPASFLRCCRPHSYLPGVVPTKPPPTVFLPIQKSKIQKSKSPSSSVAICVHLWLNSSPLPKMRARRPRSHSPSARRRIYPRVPTLHSRPLVPFAPLRLNDLLFLFPENCIFKIRNFSPSASPPFICSFFLEQPPPGSKVVPSKAVRRSFTTPETNSVPCFTRLATKGGSSSGK